MYFDKFNLPKRRPTKKKPPLTEEMLKAKRKVYAKKSRERQKEWSKELTRLKIKRLDGPDTYSYRYPDIEQIKAREAAEAEAERLLKEYLVVEYKKRGEVAYLRRHLRVREATPRWVDWAAIDEFMVCREVMNHIYPEDAPWHIDHIVPLQGKNVCGLHWHGNMQLLPSIENIRKGNKFEDGG